MMERTMFKQGAEAKLFTCDFHGKPCVAKERFSKAYRHPALDKSLTSQRIKSEVRAIMRCRQQGITVPTLYFVDIEGSCIYMECIEDSQSVRDYITQTQRDDDNVDEKLRKLGERIGQVIGKMHEHNIVHGDLTTSNMLLKGNPQNCHLIMIDFGLSHIENMAEDKGVDLYVLERAILSSHPNTETFFDQILKSYKTANKGSAAEVIDKLEEVRLRGRKRTMVG